MEMNNVEDIYPLSPMQQGMLFHTLYSPGSSVYITQLSGTLQGSSNVEIFRTALQRALKRHPVLRTAFLWDGLEEPLQVVRRDVDLPVEQIDLPASTLTERTQKFEVLLQADRVRGFDLADAPLMR